MTTLRTDYQYFSNIEWYKTLIDFKYLYFDEYENYRKMSFRNRLVIAGANGLISLSVPLIDGRDQKRSMREVQINNTTNWQTLHWRSIVSCYNRSPWFEYYRGSLEIIYMQKFDYLKDWNFALFLWVRKQLGIEVEIVSDIEGFPDSDLVDIRDRWLPKNYTRAELVAGKPVKYSQVFEDKIGFQPNLSIIDLLFCEGRATLDLLIQSKI
ncbi:MAG TPA: WbqC family protein [Parasegetibacter sp.]